MSSAQHTGRGRRSTSTSTVRRSPTSGTRAGPAGPVWCSGSRWHARQAVDDLVAELAADGAPVQQAPYDAFWGARYAVVSDPDGHAVGIMSPAMTPIGAPPDPAPRMSEVPESDARIDPVHRRRH